MDLVNGAEVINELVESLGYTRPHIINLMKANKSLLQARKRDGRWVIPKASVRVLRRIVKEQSGRRYKLGEVGAH